MLFGRRQSDSHWNRLRGAINEHRHYRTVSEPLNQIPIFAGSVLTDTNFIIGPRKRAFNSRFLLDNLFERIKGFLIKAYLRIGVPSLSSLRFNGLQVI
jgi:hypothetical protein